MIRNFIITVGIIAAVGMINTTPAQAAMCDNHGVGAGMIYKAACGATSGTGGGGGYITYADKDGHLQQISQHELHSVKHRDAHHNTPTAP